MPKVAAELGPLEIRRLSHPGDCGNVMVAVGGVAGLYMQLTPNGGKTWILRTLVGGRRRDIGLGGYPSVTLALARDKAREARGKIERGIDPVAERRAARAKLSEVRRQGLLFREAVDKALGAKLDAFRNQKHRDQWQNTLHTYAMPILGTLSVHSITTQDILRVLNQPVDGSTRTLWLAKTETASRLRGRIEAVLSWATVAGHRAGDNPARWAGNLKELLPAANKVAKKDNQPAIQIDDAQRWFAELRLREGMGSRALEFLALTAARSREVRGARWDEIDMQAGIWVIPATRMKMDREHRVPLSAAAVDLLKALPRMHDKPLVFPAPQGGEMSDMTLSATMKRLHAADVAVHNSGFADRVSGRPAVPHGLRSTFRDWVAERTDFPGDMAEVGLAHKVGNAVEAAYRRGDMVEKRRAMMSAWADFLKGDDAQSATVFSQKSGS